LSHLLASVNKEAAERIEDPAMDAPDIGTMVVYIPRAGIMRMGRREFPGIVLGHDEHGHLDLFVLMEPEDMMMEQHVRPQLNDEGHAWRHVDLPPIEGEEDAEALRSQVRDLKSELEAEKGNVEALRTVAGQIRAEVAELRKIVLGNFKPADLSVYDLLAEFEGKLNG
jgi:hypothetical protein